MGLHIIYILIGILTVALICSLSVAVTVGLMNFKYNLKKKFNKYDMIFCIIVGVISILLLMDLIGESVYIRFLQY